MDFDSLQKEFLGALPSGFEGMKRLASQKVKEITSLVDVKPFVNTQGKLLLCFVYRYHGYASVLKCVIRIELQVTMSNSFDLLKQLRFEKKS